MQEYPLDRGTYLEIVGMRHYKREIQQALGAQARRQFSGDLKCQLIAEVDNPYDSNAISVRVHNSVIGYIPAEAAEALSPILQRLVVSGYIPTATCNLTWLPPNGAPGSEGFVRASVSLVEPHLLIPINNAPANSTLLPTGRSAQVIGEEDRFDYLFDYVPKEGEARLYLELRLGTKVLKNGTQKPSVHVYLDGEQVGELSPVTGKKFEATLQHLDDVAKHAVVLGTIKGSALSASLTFNAAKSDEVDDNWVRTLPSAPGPIAPEAPSYNLPPANRPPLAVSNPLPKTAPPKAASAKSSGCMMVLITMLGIAGTIASAASGAI